MQPFYDQEQGKKTGITFIVQHNFGSPGQCNKREKEVKSKRIEREENFIVSFCADYTITYMENS